jgi:hypothetical protein
VTTVPPLSEDGWEVEIGFPPIPSPLGERGRGEVVCIPPLAEVVNSVVVALVVVVCPWQAQVTAIAPKIAAADVKRRTKARL